ncbi:deoxynucleotidyltransferase terminal-interacting protein 2 [Silurus meridionalis]|nr:deoxynucleotidyltransferase terminal-interacting protein 2 [Silurus meridionalis]
MVATRRGTRGSSPPRSTSDEAAGTPVSTTRRTRNRTVIVATPSQSKQTTDSQQDEAEERNRAPAEPASSTKRETRGSKCLPTAKQTESTNEADVSESESCCSVASDIQLTSRSKRRTTVHRKPKAVAEQEAESSSPSLGKILRRSTRGPKKTFPTLESTTSQEDEHSEAESCSSMASLSTRVIKGLRKPVVALEDVAHSKSDSGSSVVSVPQGSTVRRSTRSRVKVTEPIPINLKESETAEASATFEPRRTRGHRSKATSAEESQPYDSEGCQSGPSLSPRRTTRSRVADSDSESFSTAYTSLESPCSTRERGTPCSSRTGSASSNRAVRVSSSRNVRVTLDMVSESVKKGCKVNEPEADLSETTEDILPSLSVSTSKPDMEDIVEIEEDPNNKTVIVVDNESSIVEDNNGDSILIFDEGKAEEVESENRQGISETKKDIGECQEISDGTMETHEEAHSSPPNVKKYLSSSVIIKKSVTGPKEDQSGLTIELGFEDQLSSDPAKHEENLKVLGEPKENLKAAKMMTDMAVEHNAITDQHGTSEKGVMEDVINKTGPSSSSEASKMRVEKNKPVMACISLLDSSEDEESDNDALVDGGNDKAGDLESEDDMSCSEDQPGPSAAPDTLTGNGLFVIDARPGCLPSEKYYIETTQNEDAPKAAPDEEDFVDEEGDDDDEEDEDSKVLFTTRKPARNELSSSIDPGLKVKALGGLYINFDGSKSKSVSDNLKRLKDQKNQNELLKKSVIVADFEKKDTVPPYRESKHAAKLKRREERAKTSGDGWFNMRAPELTDELKNDLKALQMRSAMDPKRFYKKNDREGFPKYFQVGTVVDNPIDFYHSRIPKNQRKRTVVEELLSDAEFRSFNKRKYKEIMAEKAAAAAGKMNKKKHKFLKKK